MSEELENWDSEFDEQEEAGAEAVVKAETPSNGHKPNGHKQPAPTIVPENTAATVAPTHAITGRKSDRDLLEILLRDKSDAFRARVMEIVALLGVYPSDPLFYVLISTGSLQALLEQSPHELEFMFNSWSDRLIDRFHQEDKALQQRMEAYSSGAIKLYQKDVAKGVNDLINKTSVKQAQRSLPTLIWAGGICAAILTLGLVSGWLAGSAQTANALTNRLDPKGMRRLTLNELNTLNWASSKEGRYAKNLLEWNHSLLANQGAECQQQAKNLGLVLKVGEKQTANGFCPLWVVAPNQRKFEPTEKK